MDYLQRLKEIATELSKISKEIGKDINISAKKRGDLKFIDIFGEDTTQIEFSNEFYIKQYGKQYGGEKRVS